VIDIFELVALVLLCRTIVLASTPDDRMLTEFTIFEGSAMEVRALGDVSQTYDGITLVCKDFCGYRVVGEVILGIDPDGIFR
jgi:hypothetical protein